MKTGNGPAVSVIVPVYNVEKYLEECLDSLKHQTWRDFEAICIDDGATDGSGAILDRFAKEDPRFRVIHKENGGYGKAVNLGMNLAKGETFCILESDDSAVPEMLEILLKAKEKSGADVVRGIINECYGELRLPLNMYGDIPMNTLIHTADYPSLVIRPTVYSALYDLPAVRKTKVRVPETPGASFQDMGLTFAVTLRLKTEYIVPVPLVNYRVMRPGASVTVPDQWNAVQAQQSFMQETAGKDAYGAQLAAAAAFHTFVWEWERSGMREDRLEDLRKKAEELGRGLRREAMSEEDRIMLDSLLAGDLTAAERRKSRREDNIRWLREKASEKPICLYGAGKGGLNMLRYLLRIGIRPECFVTSFSESPKEYCGLPVVPVGQADRSSLCILSVYAKNLTEIEKAASEHGFSEIRRAADFLNENI